MKQVFDLTPTAVHLRHLAVIATVEKHLSTSQIKFSEDRLITECHQRTVEELIG
jgi:hypothetical protein